ncbi:MAG: peptidylprolyl isomerase [Gammaproteobacteria bacterium]|nr:peptidylprolyl isomerase [Gammaproteobacteria bacterium]
MKIDINCVVAVHYTLTNDQGDQLDSSAGREPLEYLHGGQGIIPGLEQELAGKEVGDKFVVVINPEDAYGETNPELIGEVPKSQFPEGSDIQPGMQFQAQGPNGEVQLITIRDVEEETVTIDGNHPLAGQVLRFDVSVENIRAATEQEIEHGHPH